MADICAEAFGDGLDAHAVVGEACKRLHLVHRVHCDPLDVFRKRRFRAKRRFDNSARRREVARQAALLDEEPQRRKPSCAGDHGVSTIVQAHDGEVLQ